jgi:hypothetical protein
MKMLIYTAMAETYMKVIAYFGHSVRGARQQRFIRKDPNLAPNKLATEDGWHLERVRISGAHASKRSLDPSDSLKAADDQVKGKVVVVPSKCLLNGRFQMLETTNILEKVAKLIVCIGQSVRQHIFEGRNLAMVLWCGKLCV